MNSPLESLVGIIGLGYVGLPLALEFGKRRATIGFDVNQTRLAELGEARDHTREATPDEIRAATKLRLTSDAVDLAPCGIYIVTVPTPIDTHYQPDLTALRKASETIGRVLSPGNIVIYESTVYPGATREISVPILEQTSSLTFNKDFFVGYSPERINPGDPLHRLTNITKVTSGSTPETAEIVNQLYSEIISAGTFNAESIEVAEAAKVIENTQRDLNIALMNELALIFNRMGIDTNSVLEAAATKWNFLPFHPGLVGGHCIGVDPYYLTHKAQAVGYYPEVILAGRRVNDTLGFYIAEQMVKMLIKNGRPVNAARVLVMGLTFKENCPDLRNTRVVDVIKGLRDFGVGVEIVDPHAVPQEAEHEHGIVLLAKPQCGTYDGIILAVAHDEYRDLGAEAIRAIGKPDVLLYDIKSVLGRHESDLRL